MVSAVLTPRQAAIYRFISSREYPPTVREIGRRFRIRSPNGVAGHIRALVRKGKITYDRGTARSIRPVRRRRLPLLGLIDSRTGTVLPTTAGALE